MKIELCKYLNGAPAAFSFTFDDGCYYDSSSEILEIFEDVYKKTGVKFKGTVGITVGFMHQRLIDFWRNGIKNGYFDISSHSVNHDIAYTAQTPYEKRLWDAKESKAQLQKMFEGEPVDTYIYAGGARDDEGKKALDGLYIAARGNNDGINLPGKIDWLDISCFTALLKRTTKEYTDYIDKTISNGGWGVQMNHWITSKTEDTFHAQNAKTFFEECHYLGRRASNGEVWVGSFNEVARYLWRAENSTLSVTKNDDEYSVRITPRSNDNTQKYDTPLTILVNSATPIELILENGKGEKICPRNGKIYINIMDEARFRLLPY